MATPKQHTANQANANRANSNRANSQKSTGPRTAAGKRTASLNAYKHGLTGQVVLRTPEEQAAYAALESALLRDLAPATALEHSFAARIVADTWRLERANSVERSLCDINDALADAEVTLDTGDPAKDAAFDTALAFQRNEKTFALISLYMARTQRAIHKDLDMLKKMQKHRRIMEQQAASQAEAAAKAAAKTAAKPPAATPNAGPQVIEKPAASLATGFVFSTPPNGPASPPEAPAATPENMAA